MTVKEYTEDPRSESQKQADQRALEWAQDRRKKKKKLAAMLSMSSSELIREHVELAKMVNSDKVKGNDRCFKSVQNALNALRGVALVVERQDHLMALADEADEALMNLYEKAST